MSVFVVVEERKRRKFGPRGAPADYVVVANNDHQLPLGSMSFERVT